MAVKFAVYETMRHTYVRLTDKQPGSIADLLLGGTAGAAAAAATTPVDVVKTVMMCNASSRPTITGAVKQIAAQGKGIFWGVGVFLCGVCVPVGRQCVRCVCIIVHKATPPQKIYITGVKVFFRGVGPRALSNGLNSAIFFCFFEAFRHALLKKQQQQLEARLAATQGPARGCVRARRQPVTACLSLAVPLPRPAQLPSRRHARDGNTVAAVQLVA